MRPLTWSTNGLAEAFPGKLGRWTKELDALLAVNAAKPAREQLTLIRIFEGLAERG